MFGTSERPSDIPFDFKYFKSPSKDTHNEIYNNAAIFIAASKAEGFALPPAEAMICGCALCCTDIGGFAMYAINEKTALTSKVYDVQSLTENILKLIMNNELRIKIAKNGNEFIKRFTWENSIKQFNNFLNNNINYD